MTGNQSIADQWAAVEQNAVSTGVDQPNASASAQQTTSHQGQGGTTRLPSTRKQPPTVKKYLDRITIAGLHNYLYATERYEHIVWRLTFLIAIVGTMFYLVTTIQTYREFTIVLDVQHETEPRLRLPNVWVCTEAINVSYISQQFDKARPKLLVDRRIRVLADRFRRYTKPAGAFYSRWNPTTLIYETVPSISNSSTMSWEYHLEDVIDRFILWSKTFSVISPVSDNFEVYTLAAPVLEELLYVAVNSLGDDWLGYKTFYEDGMFSCESVMKNCTLNGVAFDCCAHGPIGYSQGLQRCFRLDIGQTALARNLHRSSSSITLAFETIIDSVYFREFHSATFAATAKGSEAVEISEASGISVAFGPRMPGLFELIQHLAPATTSTITVKARKKIERTGCIESYRFDPRQHINSHPLITKYFKEMIDPKEYTVETCQFGKLLDTIYMQCGCVLYYDTIRPQRDSVICTPMHMYSCLYKAFHDVSPDDKPADRSPSPVANSSINVSVASGSVNVEDQLKRATMLQLKAESATECIPLCESWTYDFRASSMIAAGPEGNVSRYFRSKVNIIIDPEYRVDTEVYKMDYTAMIAALGDGFGLILGCSAITLIQLPIWMVAASVLRRKLNKISPLQRQGAVHGLRHREGKETVV